MSDQIVKLNPGDAFRPSAVMHNYVVDIIREYQRGQPSERAQASDDNLVYVKNGDSEPAAINSEIATITDKLAKLEQMVIVEGPGSYLSADSWVFGSDVNQVCGRTVTQQLEDATDQLDRLQNQLASIEPGTITLGMHAVVGLGDPSVSPNSDNRHLFNIVFDVASPSPSDRFGITQEPADIGSIAEVMITGETWVLVEVTDESHEYASPIAGNYERLLSQAAVGPAKIIWKEDGTGILWAYVLVDHSTAGTAGSTISGDAIWCNCTISAGVLTLEDQAGMSFVMRSSAGVYVIGFAASYATDESFTWSYYCGNSPVTLFEVGRTPNSVTVQTSTGLDVDRFGIDVHGRIGIPTTDPLPSSACGVCTTTQDTYCITFDGIATYSFYLINLCETWLSQVEVSRVGDGTGCAWDWAGPTNAIYPDTHLYVNFSYADGYWVLSVSAFLLYGYPMVQIAVYSASSAAWNCQTPLVLTKQSSTTTDICTNWPATVTVRPGSCANLPSIELRTTAVSPVATTFMIYGQNFETTPGNNVLTLNRGASATVTAATATTMTATFTVNPTSNGTLTAIVVNANGTSAPAVQVGTVVAVPTVSSNTANLYNTATTLTIAGTGFSTIASANVVTLNLGAAGTVTAATTTSLTVTLSSMPNALGSLTAIITNANGSSSPAVQVATVITNPLVGYWPMNEGTGTTLNDLSANGNDMFVPGISSIWSADTPGNQAGSGGCFVMPAGSFNPASANIPPVFTGYPSGNESRSIAFWWKASSAQSLNAYLQYGNLNVGGKYIDVGSGTYDGSRMYDGTQTALSGTTQTSDAWHHYVCTFDGTKIIFFEDGSLATIVSGITLDTNTTSGNLHLEIIKENASVGDSFKMKDLRIYNYVLSPTDVSSLYAGTFGP